MDQSQYPLHCTGEGGGKGTFYFIHFFPALSVFQYRSLVFYVFVFTKYKVLKCAGGNSQSQGRTLDESSEVFAEPFRIKAQRQKVPLVFLFASCSSTPQSRVSP